MSESGKGQVHDIFRDVSFEKKVSDRWTFLMKHYCSRVLGFVVFFVTTSWVLAQSHTLVRTGDWTLADSTDGQTSTSVSTWDSTAYTEQTLDNANVTMIVSTLTVTTTGLIGESINDRPFVKATLTIRDGSALTTSFRASDFIEGGVAVDNGNGTYTYTFSGFSLASISVSHSRVGFFLTEGVGERFFDIALSIYDYDNDENLVESGYTINATGRVEVGYVYSGALVPEPATGSLALAGIVMLFSRLRRPTA